MDSTYILAIFDSGGIGKDIFSLGFTGTGEGAGGDGIAGAGSAGRGGVSETVVGTKTGVGTSFG